MKKVTILVPCYNEEASLPHLYEALKELMDTHPDYTWEVLMVNDGSRDKTMEVIRELRQKDSRISYIDFSRNFGKEAAMLAGFDYAEGDCMVIMDADLQHPPTLIPEMLVGGKRATMMSMPNVRAVDARAGCAVVFRCVIMPCCRSVPK